MAYLCVDSGVRQPASEFSDNCAIPAFQFLTEPSDIRPSLFSIDHDDHLE